MKNYTTIVKDDVWKKVDEILSRYVKNTGVKCNVWQTVVRNVRSNGRNTVRNHTYNKHKSFKYNSLQQYKNNL
jgi:hypothetical protein